MKSRHPPEMDDGDPLSMNNLKGASPFETTSDNIMDSIIDKVANAAAAAAAEATASVLQRPMNMSACPPPPIPHIDQ